MLLRMRTRGVQILSRDFKKNIVIDRGTEAKDTRCYAFELTILLLPKNIKILIILR